jgi:charged multivesicular body protein 7
MHTSLYGLLALTLGCALVAAGPAWNDLRVTWGVNPFSKWNFAQVPRDIGNDPSAGFVPLDPKSLCDTPGAPWPGKRYMVPDDPALVLVYDVNGYIAGMQTMLPASDYTPHPGTRVPTFVKYAVNGVDYWVVSAWFVDPAIICKGGRTPDQYQQQGTGDRLLLQIGQTMKDMLVIPMQESDIGTTSWTLGHCFITMGVHYWYNVTADMNCGDFLPFFILYNNNNLNAWGFALNTKGGTSQRYEHPPLSAISGFMNPVPTCFSTDPLFADRSTMHVYFTNSPRTGDLCDLEKKKHAQ